MDKLDPGQYSVWVHIVMACVIGLGLIALGKFISWRVESTSDTLRAAQASIDRINTVGQLIIANQDEIVKNQHKIMSLIK